MICPLAVLLAVPPWETPPIDAGGARIGAGADPCPTFSGRLITGCSRSRPPVSVDHRRAFVPRPDAILPVIFDRTLPESSSVPLLEARDLSKQFDDLLANAAALEQFLRSHGIKHLLVTGVTTDVCCSAVVIAANDRSFDAIVLGDCVASYSPERHGAALAVIKAQGGIFGWVTDSKRVLVALWS